MQQPLNCTCGKSFSFAPVPVEIINKPQLSMAVAVHPLIKCPHCGQSFVSLMAQVQTAWTVKPISEADRRKIEGSEIIVAAGIKP